MLYKKPCVTKRICETECETRSESEVVVLKPVTSPKPKGVLVGAGEDPSTLSPASSACVLPDDLQSQQLGEMLIKLDNGDTEERAAECIVQTDKNTNINFSKDAIENLKIVGTEYHKICSTTALKILDVIKNITGNLVDFQNNEAVVNFMQKDAKVIESRIKENEKKFHYLVTSLESNLFCQLQIENSELKKTEEKINYLEKENAHLQSMVTLTENKAQDYKVKFDEIRKSLENEREQVKRLQAEKGSVELEMKTKFLTEQQKCEKLEHMIKNIELDIKCKDEIYEKSRQDYQNKTNLSSDLNAKLEKEKTQLESRLEEITNEKAKLSALLKELSLHAETEKEKLQQEERSRKKMMTDLDEIKKKEIRNKEIIKELEEIVTQKKENEDRLSSQLYALKEGKCSFERRLLSQELRISELEKEKAAVLVETEAVSNILLAEKERTIHQLQEELKTCRKEISSSKELCTQLEYRIRSMQDSQANDTTKQQFETLSKERHSMESALEKAYEYNTCIEQELEDARQEVEKMVKLIHEKNCLLKVRNDLIIILQNTESAQQKEIDRAASEMDSYRRHHQKMQAELKEKDGQLKSLIDELKRMESDLAKAKTKSEVLEKRHNDQRARLEARIAELESARHHCNNKTETLSCVGTHNTNYAHCTKTDPREHFTNTKSGSVCIPQLTNNLALEHDSKQINNNHCTPVTLITHADTVVIDRVQYVDSKRETAKQCNQTCLNHCFVDVKNPASKMSNNFVSVLAQNRESVYQKFNDKANEIHVIQTEIVENETSSANVSTKHSSNEICLITEKQKTSNYMGNILKCVSNKPRTKLIVPIKLFHQK